MATYPFYHIDAFASKAMEGNPAAIMPLDQFLPTEKMQAIAAENNLPETAFIVSKGDGLWDLRWFTPTLEVPLCGHATLAAAHVIFKHEAYTGHEIGFDTLSGRLTVIQLPDGRLEMDFPSDQPTQIDIPPALIDAIGERPSQLWIAGYMLAIFDTVDQIKALNPDLNALEPIAAIGQRERGNLICAAIDGSEFDVVSRFFAPGSGIPEDPATGSAHCILAPLFSEKLGKPELSCFQAFPGRGAQIDTRLEGDRVKLMGKAITLIEGKFHI